MAQGAKVTANKPINLNAIPGITWWKERTKPTGCVLTIFGGLNASGPKAHRNWHDWEGGPCWSRWGLLETCAPGDGL